MFHFDFLEKDLVIVSSALFVYDFSRKMFLMLYSINWPKFIIWLPLVLKILDNMCIAIVCFPDCDVISFEINFIFLINPFFYMTKNIQDKSLNMFRTKRALKVKWKAFFVIFIRAFSCKKLFQIWQCTFKTLSFDIVTAN